MGGLGLRDYGSAPGRLNFNVAGQLLYKEVIGQQL